MIHTIRDFALQALNRNLMETRTQRQNTRPASAKYALLRSPQPDDREDRLCIPTAWLNRNKLLKSTLVEQLVERGALQAKFHGLNTGVACAVALSIRFGRTVRDASARQRSGNQKLKFAPTLPALVRIRDLGDTGRHHTPARSWQDIHIAPPVSCNVATLLRAFNHLCASLPGLPQFTSHAEMQIYQLFVVA